MTRHKKDGLSATNRKIYEFIILYKSQNNGNSPTIREIMNSTPVKSTSVVAYNLARLEELGLITVSRKSSRGIEVSGSRWIPPLHPMQR